MIWGENCDLLLVFESYCDNFMHLWVSNFHAIKLQIQFQEFVSLTHSLASFVRNSAIFIQHAPSFACCIRLYEFASLIVCHSSLFKNRMHAKFASLTLSLASLVRAQKLKVTVKHFCNWIIVPFEHYLSSITQNNSVPLNWL